MDQSASSRHRCEKELRRLIALIKNHQYIFIVVSETILLKNRQSNSMDYRMQHVKTPNLLRIIFKKLNYSRETILIKNGANGQIKSSSYGHARKTKRSFCMSSTMARFKISICSGNQEQFQTFQRQLDEKLVIFMC